MCDLLRAPRDTACQGAVQPLALVITCGSVGLAVEDRYVRQLLRHRDFRQIYGSRKAAVSSELVLGHHNFLLDL